MNACCRAIGLLLTVSVVSSGVFAAEEAPRPVKPELDKKIDAALAKAKDSLVQLPATSLTDSEASIVAYALHKSGLPATHPKISGAVDSVLKKVSQGTYGTGNGPVHHVYEAACDAMLLVDIDPEKYRDQLSVLRDYLVGKQRTNGSWHYPVTPPNDDVGDTSISQFAILGLWAIKRADIEVSTEIWDKAARWFLATQQSDGGFAYHPQEREKPEFFNSTLSMTAAGAASLMIIQRMLYDGRIVSSVEAIPSSRKRFGVLEAFPVENAGNRKPAAPAVGKKVSYDLLERHAKQAVSWIGAHFEPHTRFHFFTYELYGCERVGSLTESEKLGTHKWYEEGAELLVAEQRPSGDWIATSSPHAMTAFGILFLTRATQSIVQPRVKVRLTGAGLLAGGRGLPDDLSKVAIEDGSVKQRRNLGPIDELLADLEKAAVEEKPVNPQSVIVSLQFDKPEELLGKLDQLPALLANTKPEVRQVAAWAMGRSGDIRMAPRLIEALSDPDINVAADASLGLCVLSRQPLGVTKGEFSKERVTPEPPDAAEFDFDGEPLPAEQVTAAKAAVALWRRESIQGWTRWYLLNRPYDERDDRTQIRTK